MTDFESRRADWLSVEEALGRVLASARPGPPERVALEEALGRVLTGPVTARATLPPWDNSAMDGYAVRAADVRGASGAAPIRLRVAGVARAGAPAGKPLEPGTALRIMTGAPVPAGADSVVRVEDTDRERGQEGVVEVRSQRDAGRNVRPQGQDMRAGNVVLDPGAVLGPGQIGVAAAAGHGHVRVHRLPRVAILSNGDELRTLDDWDDVPRGAGLPETNGPTLAACVRAAGAVSLPPRLALDTPESIREHLEAAFEADVLVTSGGASMGEADLFKRVLERLGFDLAFWRVALRPGSPLSFGFLPVAGRAPLPVFGLPGNPSSAFVTFELFVRPYLLAAAGHRRIHRPVVRAAAGEALPGTGRLTHFHRVVLDQGPAGPIARLTGPQGSGLVHSLGRAQALAVVPRGAAGIAEGAVVEVIVLDEALGASDRPGFTP